MKYYVQFVNGGEPYTCNEVQFEKLHEKYKLSHLGANVYSATKKPEGKKKTEKWKDEILRAARELQYPAKVRKLLLAEDSEFKCSQIMTAARLGYFD